MNEIPMDQQLEEYKRRLDAANNALMKLQNENIAMRANVQVMEAQKAQWTAEKIQQLAIIQQSLQDSNFRSQQHLEEIAALREKLRNLGG